MSTNILSLSLNPSAMTSIIEAQSCPKVIVGDPHQQIYSFRGAVNALDLLKSTHIYYLTEVSLSA